MMRRTPLRKDPVMKFNVMNNGLGTYEVKLHWETKEKIQKVFGYTLLAATGAAAGWYYINKTNDETETEE
jgi:hypothetical protein